MRSTKPGTETSVSVSTMLNTLPPSTVSSTSASRIVGTQVMTSTTRMMKKSAFLDMAQIEAIAAPRTSDRAVAPTPMPTEILAP